MRGEEEKLRKEQEEKRSSQFWAAREWKRQRSAKMGAEKLDLTASLVNRCTESDGQ